MFYNVVSFTGMDFGLIAIKESKMRKRNIKSKEIGELLPSQIIPGAYPFPLLGFLAIVFENLAKQLGKVTLKFYKNDNNYFSSGRRGLFRSIR